MRQALERARAVGTEAAEEEAGETALQEAPPGRGLPISPPHSRKRSGRHSDTDRGRDPDSAGGRHRKARTERESRIPRNGTKRPATTNGTSARTARSLAKTANVTPERPETTPTGRSTPKRKTAGRRSRPGGGGEAASTVPGTEAAGAGVPEDETEDLAFGLDLEEDARQEGGSGEAARYGGDLPDPKERPRFGRRVEVGDLDDLDLGQGPGRHRGAISPADLPADPGDDARPGSGGALLLRPAGGGR